MRYDMAAEVREQAGKGAARQLRRNGKIPAVLYGQGECLLLSLNPETVTKVLHSRGGSTALISLNIAGATSKKARTALFRDYQVDPVTGEILHVDLFEVSMNKAIRIKVPVSLVGGVPEGVKEGGLLHHNLRELHVECLPAAIPDSIEVDASSLLIGQGIHVRELTPKEGVKFLDEIDQMVVSVAAPMSEAKLEALLTSSAVAEPGKEPEVIGKGKEEPQEGEEVAAEKGAAVAEKGAPTAAKGTATAEPKADKKESKESKEPKAEKKESKEPKAEKKEAKEQKK